MIQRLCVCGKFFWSALLHCKSPVYLLGQENNDLRFLSDTKKDAVISSVSKEQITIVLYFSDSQDYVRFVLAYLLVETSN